MDDIKKVLFATAKEFNEKAIEVNNNPQMWHLCRAYATMATGIEEVIVRCGLYDEYVEFYDESEVKDEPDKNNAKTSDDES